MADANASRSRGCTTDSSSPTDTVMSAGSNKTSCPCSTDIHQGRNLVICIDGTSNKYGDKSTNIVELYSQIIKDDTQLTYYNSGVGTFSRPYGLAHTHMVERASSILDLAIAHKISKNIIHAYGWLSDKYQDGDKIFLFGFSRRAYQVRALAGMIHEVGLILPGNKEQIPYAFQLYSDINNRGRKLAEGFKATFSRQRVVIHFIGVWDTVSSVGIRKAKNLPSTDTCSHVCYFRQALALDGRRVKFLPEYVYGGMGDRCDGIADQPARQTDEGHSHIKEVWFAGSHSDVGGVGRPKGEPLDFRDMPLLWMREEALEARLRLNAPKVTFRHGDFKEPKITDSLSLPWWLLEALPIRHLRYGSCDKHSELPHLGRGRIILPGQKVHPSILFRTDYRPQAVFSKNLQQWPEVMHWHRASVDAQLPELGHAWEQWPFKRSTAEALVRNGAIDNKDTLDYVDRLAFICSFELGVEAVRNLSVNPLDKLKIYIHDTDGSRRVRLGALVAYCRLGMSCRLDKEGEIMLETVLDALDVPGMLEDQNTICQRRACEAIPPLCKIETIRVKLLTRRLIHQILDLCRTADENKSVAAKTLSFLAQHFDEASSVLLHHECIEKIIALLEDRSKIVVVAALRILRTISSKARAIISGTRGKELVRKLKKLMKCRDFFVTPAAIAALCAICSPSDDNKELLTDVIQCDILATLIELIKFDDQRLSCGTRGLTELAESSEDVRNALARGSHIKRLVQFAKSKVVERSKEATEELTKLSKHDILRKKIIAEKGVQSVVENWAAPDHALFAAEALLILMKYSDAKECILRAPHTRRNLLQMIEKRIFNGTIVREGKVILSDIMNDGDLRFMVLSTDQTDHRLPKAGNLFDILCKMLDITQLYAVQRSAVIYLSIIADHDDARSRMHGTEIVKALVRCLKVVDSQTVSDVLQKIARDEELRHDIKMDETVTDMLSSHDPTEVLSVTTVLKSLSSYGDIREKVQGMPVYKNLKGDFLYYLDPHHVSERDLYASASEAIGSMIDAYGGDTIADTNTEQPLRSTT